MRSFSQPMTAVKTDDGQYYAFGFFREAGSWKTQGRLSVRTG